MATRIRKCANPRCSDIIGGTERPDKKFCSQECKTQTHNERNSKKNLSWSKVIEKYNSQPKESSLPLDKWLELNYYPPREIKNKK